MEYRTIQVTLATNAGAFAGQMGQAGAAVNQFGTQLQRAEAGFARAGRTMMSAGKLMTAAVTLPLAAIGAASVKAAIDFESSFAGVRKTVDATEAEFAQLEQGFRSLSKEIPVNVNELNRIGEAAGQLGIEKENIISFTDTVAKMGVATNLASEEAANAFARIGNVMGTSQTDFDRLGSTIVDLGNNLATTESEIVEFGLRISGAGKIAGLAEADVLAIGGAMASVGVQAAAGGTAVQKVLLDITKAVTTSSDQLEQYAEVAGMSAQEFAQAWESDAAGAFTAFVEGLGAAGDDAIGILSELGLEDQRLIRSFLSLAGAGDLLRNSIELGNDAWAENTALTKEAEQRFATFASQWQLFKNQLNDVFISLGQALMPTLRNFVGFMQDSVIPAVEKAVAVFTGLPESMQTMIVVAAGVAAAIGPVLIGLGLMATAVSNMLPLFASMKAASVFIGPLSTNARLAGPAFLAMAGSLRTAAGAARALGVALKGAALLFAVDFIVGGAIRASSSLGDLEQQAKAVGEAFKGLPNEVELISREISRHEAAIASLSDEYTVFGSIKSLVFGPDLKAIRATREHETALEQLGGALKDAKQRAEEASNPFLAFANTLEDVTEESGETSRASDLLAGAAERAAKAQDRHTQAQEAGLAVTGSSKEAIQAQAEALDENASAHDSWAAVLQKNLGSTVAAHDSWRSTVEKNFADSVQSHDSWESSFEENLRANASAHDLWVNRALPAYEAIMAKAGEFTAAIDAQSKTTFEGLQLQGEALEEFVGNFTSAYEEATSVLSVFAGESQVTSQQILQHYQDQLAAVQNWHSNLMILANEIGDTGPGKALLQEMAEAGPEMAPVLQGLIDAIRDGNIDAILESRTAINELMNQTLEDVQGKGPELAQATGTWAEQIEKSLAPTFAQLKVDLEEIDTTQAVPEFSADDSQFTKFYHSAVDRLRDLDGDSGIPTLDANPAPFDGKIRAALGWLDNITGRTGVPTLDARPDPFDGKIRNALNALDMITGRTAIPTISADPNPFDTHARNINNALGNIGGTAVYPTVGVNDQASGKLASIQSALRSIAGNYTAQINVRDNRHSGGAIFHDGGSIGPIVTMHDGGLRPDERIIKAQTGEFMLQRSAVQGLGVDLLREMNATGRIPWSRFVDAQGGAQGSRAQADALREQLSGLGDSIRTVVKERTGDTIINVRAVPDLRKKDMGVTRFINEVKEALDGKMEAMK